jgi:hypothetical protein
VPKVYVDASVFTKVRAFGRVSGNIDVPIIPQVGDHVAFGPRGSPSDFAVIDLLRVTDRIISANGDAPVSLSLSDITVETDDDARKVVRFLEESHGLFGETWEDAP